MEEIANKDTFKNYLILWSGQLVSLLGSMVVFIAITYWIAISYDNSIISAFTAFIFSLMMTICLPFAGVIADRINRKVLIVIVDSLQAYVTIILIILLQFGVANIWIICLFIALRSMFQAFHIPTVNAIIPTMVPREKLSRINGINYLFTGVIQFFAPFISAICLVFFSIYTILWLDIITFFIALIPLLFISIPSVYQVNNVNETIEKNSFLKEFKLGLKTLRIIPGVIIMILLSMLLNFLISPVNSLMALYITDFHGGIEWHYAYSQMVFTGGMISGALLTSLKKNWNNKIRVIFISLLLATIGYFIFAIAPSGSFYILGLGGIILGFNIPIINSLYQTFIQTAVPTDKLGRVTSVDYALSSAISPIGIIISGILASLLGIQLLFIYCSLIGILCTIGTWSLTNIRKVDLDTKEALEQINGNIENLTI